MFNQEKEREYTEEEYLLLQLVYQAIKIYLSDKDSTEKTHAQIYLFVDDKKSPTSFYNICEHFDKNPDRIRLNILYSKYKEDNIIEFQATSRTEKTKQISNITDAITHDRKAKTRRGRNASTKEEGKPGKNSKGNAGRTGSRKRKTK